MHQFKKIGFIKFNYFLVKLYLLLVNIGHCTMIWLHTNLVYLVKNLKMLERKYCFYRRPTILEKMIGFSYFVFFFVIKKW